MAPVLPEMTRKLRSVSMSSVDLPRIGRQQHRKADAYCFAQSPAMQQPISANKMKTALSTPAPFQPSPVFSPSALAFLEKRRSLSRSGIDRCSNGVGAWGLSSHREDIVVSECRPPSSGRRPSSAGAGRHPSSALVDTARKQVEQVEQVAPVKTKSKLLVERTVSGITRYLEEAGETADNASFIMQRMLQADGFLLDIELGGVILIGSFDEFRHKTKNEIEQTLLSHLPDFNLSCSQQTLVTDRLLATLPMATLVAPEPPEDMYEDAVMHVLCESSAHFAANRDDVSKQVVLRIASKKCMKQFPEWGLTDSQKRVVVDTMLKTVPILDMASFEPQSCLYLNSLELAVSSNPEKFERIDETLRHLFGEKFSIRFPNWPLSDLQKVTLVDRILKTLPISELSTCEPQEFHYRDALTYEASSGCMRCPVCMDPMVEQKADGSIDTSKMWFAPLRRTEHWSNNPCGHVSVGRDCHQ